MTEENRHNYTQLTSNFIKLKENDKYIAYNLLKDFILETNIPKQMVEEENSELFYETLTGEGKLVLKNKMKYFGKVKMGMLESRIEVSEKSKNEGENSKLKSSIKKANVSVDKTKSFIKIKNKENKESKKDKNNIQFKQDFGGKSTIIFPDGTKYIGEIHNNKITGKGEYYFNTGAVYVGELLNGFRNGKGKYTSKEGIEYEGEWLKGLKHGKGTMKRKDMEYTGEFKNGHLCGKGKIKWTNGNVYSGEIKGDNLNGRGLMFWRETGEKYVGMWKNGRQNGIGTHVWDEPRMEMREMKNRYVGDWVNGLRSGYGIFFYANGGKYEGAWDKNKKNGFGVFTFQDGSVYKGRFKEDVMIDENDQITEEQAKILYFEYKKKREEDKEGSRKLVGNKSVSSLNGLKISRKSLNTSLNSSKKISDFGGVPASNPNLSERAQNPMQKQSQSPNKINAQEKESNSPQKSPRKPAKLTQKMGNFTYNFDFHDLVIFDPKIKEDIKEINNVILRNLSQIKRVYNLIMKKKEGMNEEETEEEKEKKSRKRKKNPSKKKKVTKKIKNYKKNKKKTKLKHKCESNI